jgi:hypothetical protein
MKGIHLDGQHYLSGSPVILCISTIECAKLSNTKMKLIFTFHEAYGFIPVLLQMHFLLLIQNYIYIFIAFVIHVLIRLQSSGVTQVTFSTFIKRRTKSVS